MREDSAGASGGYPATRAANINDVWRTHPLLDPRLPSRQPALARRWLRTWRQMVDGAAVAQFVERALTAPLGGPAPGEHQVAGYLTDAEHYLEDLLRLVPEARAKALRTQDSVARCTDAASLLRGVFEGAGPRERFESQRKLYLAKLLFDIEHCRSVRDGLRHQAHFERLLDHGLWPRVNGGHETEVCCELREDGAADGDRSPKLALSVAPSPGARCWRFQVRRLRLNDPVPEVDVFQYRSRFKQDTTFGSEHGFESGEGTPRPGEASSWPALGRRSGSIVSKMIRRAIGDPHLVQDLLGAMFIVGDRAQAYALERQLVDTLGGPFRWRDRIDTLIDERDRAALDPHSGAGFQVLKQVVDVLIDDPVAKAPYLFGVEIQIYPLEAYLRTLHEGHLASHAAYKRRQFLEGLLPILFPEEIYGSHGERGAREEGRARGPQAESDFRRTPTAATSTAHWRPGR